MDQNMQCLILTFFLIVIGLCKLQDIPTLIPLNEEEAEKVELRKELDEIMQDLVKEGPEHHLYHSYIFNSGIGNREELEVEELREEPEFAAGEGVLSWQSVGCGGSMYLLGRKLDSLSLITTSIQLPSNRSAQFYEHSLGMEANVSSTSMYTRWNPAKTKQEVIVVVTVDSPTFDIIWYRIVNNKLEIITRKPRYTKTSAMAAVNVGNKNRLVIVDTKSPATVDVFEDEFSFNSSNLNLRVVQSFTLEGGCLSLTICNVNTQLYLVLPQVRSVSVHRLVSDTKSSHFQHHTTLPLPHVTQSITFSLANQVYLAINGETGHVLRITDAGDFIVELTQKNVNEWLAVPVYSYRSDIVLLSRGANLTQMFVWGGTNKGFKTIQMPAGSTRLEGDWSGAVPVQFPHQPCLLLPRPHLTSNLVTVITSLQYKNSPVLKKAIAILEDMKRQEKVWLQIQSNMSEAEEMLRYVIKPGGKNVITAKWKLSRLETLNLKLNSILQPVYEVNNTHEPLSPEEADLVALQSMVEETISGVSDLTSAVKQKEKQTWGLNGFKGKVHFKGRLMIKNLTLDTLNYRRVNDVLQHTFRRDQPKVIKGNKVIQSLEVENIIVNMFNGHIPAENLKFSDETLVIKGNMSLMRPLTVSGDVEVASGGKVNGLDFSEHLCQGKERCSVVVDFSDRKADIDNHIDKNVSSVSQHRYRKVYAGRNLTVNKVNGVDWEILMENIVYKDRNQNVSGTVVVNGTLSSNDVVWENDFEDDYKPKQRESDHSSPVGVTPTGKIRPGIAQKKIVEDISPIDPLADAIFSELEVTGTVTCMDSEWGDAASDLVFRDANPVIINATKTFSSGISVTNNLVVGGLVGGVNVSDLLTLDTHQVFYGPTTMQGNITMGNVSLTGLMYGLNISNFSYPREISAEEVVANRVEVLETVNGVPISDLVVTDDKGITLVNEAFAESVDVTEDIIVEGKVCNQNLNEFISKRLSIEKEQNITGKFSIGNVNVRSEFEIQELNDVKVLSLVHELQKSAEVDGIHLSEMYVDGDIITDLGVNGFNLSEIAENAVWLHSNNEITGHLTFKDEVTFGLLECQGFLNQKPCTQWYDGADIVYKNKGPVIISGVKTFLNPLTISKDLYLKEINGHRVKDILTKTTEQNITGDVFIEGDVTFTEDSTVLGLLNSVNISELANRCALSGNNIRCKGNAAFKGSVHVERFKSAGKLNGVDFDSFVDSLVDIRDPQPITGLKNFTGKTKVLKNLEVKNINNQNWEDFLLDAVTQNSHEEVKFPVVFEGEVTVDKLSVDHDLDANSISGVNLTEWRTNAIYLDRNFSITRPIHLISASSRGDLKINEYGDVDMIQNIIKLHESNSVSALSFKSVTVTGDVNILGRINGHNFKDVEENTFKKNGDQTVNGGLAVVGNLTVSGNFTVLGLVDLFNISEVVTLDSDQTLHGNYKFSCLEALENVSSLGLMSGINMTEWGDTAVTTDSDQDVTGMWSVKGNVQFQGPVKGPGWLENIDLQELRDNITREIINIQKEMKANLSSKCEDTSRHINAARNQPSDLLYVETSQHLSVTSDLSLVKHFKSKKEDFLVVSDKSCTTSVVMWDKFKGTFFPLHEVVSNLTVDQIVALHYDQLIYLVTASPEQETVCHYPGIHLWLLSDQQLKHITSLDHIQSNQLEGYKNSLFSMNKTGVYKWNLVLKEGIAFLDNTRKWSVVTDGRSFIPSEAGVGLALYDSIQVVSLESDFDLPSGIFNNCTGEINSFSISLNQQFVAVATSEKTEVPRFSDHIKVYREDGRLFDKLPAQRVSHLRWLSVLDQTWLAVLQNNTSLLLYRLQGPIQGFQLKLSATIAATSLATLSLPRASKVNLQPYLILQSPLSVKILRPVMQADPYLGPDLSCDFDDDLKTIP